MGGAAGEAAFLGFSITIASVLIKMPAIDAAPAPTAAI
jgi:hypothetical protein